MGMTKDEAQELFAYTAWATSRFVGAVEVLTQEEREAVVPGSFPSLLSTLGHIVGVEWVWYRRWLGESPSSLPAWAEPSTLTELKEHLAKVESERGAFLAALTDPDLENVVTYRAPDGLTFSHKLADLIRHVINHSTYHRGQLATQLRHLGHTPPSTDFTKFLREGKGDRAFGLTPTSGLAARRPA